MHRNINNVEKVFKNIIYFSLVFILSYIIGLAMDLSLGFFKQIGFTLILSVITRFFLWKPILLYLIILSSIVIGLIVNHYFPFIEKLFEIIYGFFENILNYISGREDLITQNILWFWGLLIIFIALYTGYIIFKEKRISYLLPLYIAAFVYYWYVFFNIAYFLIAIFFFLYFILLGLDKYSRGQLIISKINKTWLATIIIYSFLIVALALLVPKIHKSIHWPWLQNTAYAFFPGMEDWRSTATHFKGEGQAEDFALSKTGYQRQTSRLGGPVRLSDKEVMTVYGEGPFYLRGNIRHTYTGHVWKTLDNPKEIYLSGQSIDRISNDERIYYDYKSITIKNHFFSSTTLFSPYSPAAIYLNGNYEIHLGPDFELIFPAGRYAGEEYTIKVLEPLPYPRLIDLGKNRSKKDLKNLTQYLQVPRFKISKELKDLTHEIVKNTSSDYEKAIAIENYLRDNFKYNTDVEVPPRNREFVDYFLFESKEGYCTYFATSMAIMLRLQGIPSRYVEGYVARDLIDENTYIVKQKNAHAWVEAFIEPVGWMTFEPTPAYRPIPRTMEESPVFAPSEEKDEGLWDFDIIGPLGERKHVPTHGAELNEQMANGEKTDLETEISQEESISVQNILKILVLGIALVATLKLLVGFIKGQILKRKIAKLSNKERLIYEYNEILKLTKALGYPMVAGETHYEYANRVAYRFSVFGDRGIKEITELFVKHKYSSIETKNEHVKEIVEFKELLRRRLRRGLRRGLRMG